MIIRDTQLAYADAWRETSDGTDCQLADHDGMMSILPA